ncbi:TetR/AcrR family transcriptional regulator [Methanobacterium sp. MBAC-LM]|jgi:AcrR family transcriptional regulator|uniref:TetR/AcrR family transcriptional regulator n=1 Tax=Methanobacterium sp. MBAC-LM TaxID=3412034 RepID=UPI003C773946
MKNQTADSKTEKKSTKEKIFDVSLDLFSQKGFDAVSVREIAREVGIRESSIYNHYKNKEAILDAIIDYFMSELTLSNPPEEEMEKLMETPELFFEVGARAFIGRMSAPKTEKIWRIISIELYHNEKIREFFKKELLEVPILAWEGIFTKMMEKNVIKRVDPKILAYEYFSFAIYLYFEYFVLDYEETGETFMEMVWEKMSNHAQFILDAIKLEE